MYPLGVFLLPASQSIGSSRQPLFLLNQSPQAAVTIQSQRLPTVAGRPSQSTERKRSCGDTVMADEHEKNLIEILEENHPIDINKYTNYVHSPQCGAIATFYGNTRDTFDGKTVIELRYEAYVPMAIRCLKSICSSARSLWNLNAIAVAHRLGPVSVGETSVFVAISSVHRVDALDACKFVIDELKASVPIWKKEIYSNGEVWKENFEFLERRPDLGNSAHLQPKVKVEGDEVAAKPVKNGCCRPKVKVEDGESVRSSNDC